MLGLSFLETASKKATVLALAHGRPLQPGDCETACVDVRDESALSSILRAFRPEWVFHAAAVTDVDWCEAHPEEAWSVNVDGTSAVVRAAAAVGARVLLVSTDAVFGGAAGPHGEDSPVLAVNTYALTKLRAEETAVNLEPETLVARVNFIGWRPSGGGLLGWALRELRASRTLQGWADVLFSPLAAPDLAVILLEMAERGLSGLYCVGAAEGISKAEFLRRVAVTWGCDPDLVQPQKAGISGFVPRPLDTRLDTGRLARSLGHPLPGIGSGLALLRTGEAKTALYHVKSLQRKGATA